MANIERETPFMAFSLLRQHMVDGRKMITLREREVRILCARLTYQKLI